MPPLNLLFLALLGGFVFVTKWYPTKYYTLRSDGYRLLFTTAVAGAFLLFLASVAKTHVAPRLPLWPEVYVWWHQIAPADHSGKAALAMLLGCTLWFPLNLVALLGARLSSPESRFGRFISWFTDEEAVNRAIEGKRDALESFLTMALNGEEMISVSVQNGKAYVGYLTSNFNPAFEMESISLIPAFSGHRIDETKELVLDLDYLEVYRAIQPDLYGKLLDAVESEQNENPKAADPRFFTAVMQRLAFDAGQEYEIIIPIREVQSANVFHVDSYINYFTKGADKIPAPPESETQQKNH